MYEFRRRRSGILGSSPDCLREPAGLAAAAVGVSCDVAVDDFGTLVVRRAILDGLRDVAGVAKQLAFCQLGEHSTPAQKHAMGDRKGLRGRIYVIELQLIGGATSDALAAKDLKRKGFASPVPRAGAYAALFCGVQHCRVQTRQRIRRVDWLSGRGCYRHGGALVQRESDRRAENSLVAAGAGLRIGTRRSVLILP